jgi:hypothetical protein
MLIGLEAQVSTICKTSSHGQNQCANVANILTLHLGQSILSKVGNKLLQRFNRQATHLENGIH